MPCRTFSDRSTVEHCHIRITSNCKQLTGQDGLFFSAWATGTLGRRGSHAVPAQRRPYRARRMLLLRRTWAQYATASRLMHSQPWNCSSRIWFDFLSNISACESYILSRAKGRRFGVSVVHNRRNNPAKRWFSSRCRNAKVTKGMRHAIPLGPDGYVVKSSAPKLQLLHTVRY